MNMVLTANPITVITKFIPEDIIFSPRKKKKSNLQTNFHNYRAITISILFHIEKCNSSLRKTRRSTEFRTVTMELLSHTNPDQASTKHHRWPTMTNQSYHWSKFSIEACIWEGRLRKWLFHCGREYRNQGEDGNLGGTGQSQWVWKPIWRTLRAGETQRKRERETSTRSKSTVI